MRRDRINKCGDFCAAVVVTGLFSLNYAMMPLIHQFEVEVVIIERRVHMLCTRIVTDTPHHTVCPEDHQDCNQVIYEVPNHRGRIKSILP